MFDLIEGNEGKKYIIFENREDAARRLAEKLEPLPYENRKKDSINRANTRILAIPRGGVVTGDVLASILGLNLDIIVSRKNGAPDNPGIPRYELLVRKSR